ncbi:MAG: hypothetical protein K1060chlam5_01342 [Candidatus Anoxychlamydiales bacterium]|nr:hypothetical protein [Candidatus Anoxychlamydiales bacterium]
MHLPIISNLISVIYDRCFGVMTDQLLEKTLNNLEEGLESLNIVKNTLNALLAKLNSDEERVLLTDKEHEDLNNNFINLVKNLKKLNHLKEKIDDYTLNSPQKNQPLLQRYAVLKKQLDELEILRTNLILKISNTNPIAEKSKFQRVLNRTVVPIKTYGSKILNFSKRWTGHKTSVVAAATFALWNISLINPSTVLCLTGCSLLKERISKKPEQNNNTNNFVLGTFALWSVSIISLPTTLIINGVAMGAKYAQDTLRKI